MTFISSYILLEENQRHSLYRITCLLTFGWAGSRALPSAATRCTRRAVGRTPPWPPAPGPN